MKPRRVTRFSRSSTPEPIMSLPRIHADVINLDPALELESIDCIDLNVSQPRLQTPPSDFYILRENFAQGAISIETLQSEPGYVGEISAAEDLRRASPITELREFEITDRKRGLSDD